MGTRNQLPLGVAHHPSVQPRRPFRVLGLQQIALGSLDRKALESLWVQCFGLLPTGHFRSERENVDEVILALGLGLATVEVDLMQPINPEARPKTDAPALHHVGLWIDDLHAAAHWLICAGVRLTPGGIRRGATGHEVCFIHPRPSPYFPICGSGVLIELVQAPKPIVTAYEALAQAQVAALTPPAEP